MKRIFFLGSLTLSLLAGAASAAPEGPSSPAPALVVQAPHGQEISALALSRDGRLLVSGSDDRTLKVWDAASGRLLRTLRGHSGEVTTLALFPDSKRALSGAEFRWENVPDQPDDPEEPARKAAEERKPWGRPAAIPEDEWQKQIDTVSDNLKIWSLETGRVVGTLECYRKRVDAVALSADGRYALAGGSGFPLSLYDTATGKILARLIGGVERIRALAFAPDGRSAASAGENGSLRFWSIPEGKLLGAGSGHVGEVRSLAFSADGKRLLSVGEDQTVRIWDSGTLSLISTATVGEKQQAVAFSPDGKNFVTTGSESVRVWDSGTGKLLATAKEIAAGPAVFSGNGSTVFYGDGGRIKEWDFRQGGTSARVLGNAVEVIGDLAFAPGSDSLTLSSRRLAAVWDLKEGTATILRQEPLALDASLAGTADKKYVIAASVDGSQIERLDLRKPDGNTLFTPAGGHVAALDLSSDGQRLVSWSDDSGRITLWDMASTRKLSDFKGKVDQVSLLQFSRDRALTLVGSRDHSTRVFKTDSGELLAELSGHDGWVLCGDFSPDRRYLVTGSQGMFFHQRNRLILWELATGKPLRVMPERSGWVTAALFSPAGTEIVSGSDRLLKRWDFVTGTPQATYREHADTVTAATFAYDGKYLFSSAADGATILWDAKSARWLAKLYLFEDGTWVVSDREGRFDTNNLEDIKGLHWVMPDDPLKPLPLEVFMRDYYEPRLLPRILAGEALREVRDLSRLNRIQPEVEVVSVKKRGTGSVDVSLRLRRGQGSLERQGRAVTVTSGARDLKLFRDGQLVGFRAGDVLAAGAGNGEVRFENIQLPGRAGLEQVEFSGYAFNDDGIKSRTARYPYRLPPRTPARQGVAYLVTIGVNEYQSSAWNLQFAVNDATLMNQVLSKQLEAGGALREVVPVLLTDRQATRSNLQGLFARLAGRPAPAGALAGIAGAERLAQATPDDLVVVTYSGHGHADRGGAFYLFPHDIGAGHERVVSEELLSRLVSSRDLEDWYREVDAGNLALVIDACHSAASVGGEGFKPGPMGSRGLGQLAYDKGMRILAASQADDVALESDALQQGLLTYALLHDGIKAFQADFKPNDSSITLAEWLAYGVERVPGLAQEVRAGKVQSLGRGEASRAVVRWVDPKQDLQTRENSFQTPALFDFTRGRRDVGLAQEGL